MSKKTTKRAFLTSLLALTLCFTMLLGTTYAWFTDSVTSGKNTIVSGNLDIAVEYYNGTTWADMNGATNLFDQQAKWEPGHTEVIYLKLYNAGTLSLKYQLGVNVFGETGSVNVYGDEFKLSDYIMFSVIEGIDENALYADREAALAAAKAADNATLISEGYSSASEMHKGDAPLCIAMVVYMPEEVGNEANYGSDYKAPYIEMGVNVIASQLAYESDSFGDDYDELAPEGEVIASGKTYKTIEDAIAADETTVYVAGHHKLTAANAGKSTDLEGLHIIGITPDATVEMVGNGGGLSNVVMKNLKVVDSTVYTYENGENAWEFTYFEFDGTNRFDTVAFDDGIMLSGTNDFVNCTFSGHNNDSSDLGNTTMYGVWVIRGDAEFNGCTFNGTRGLKACDMYKDNEVNNVVVDNCRFVALSEKPGVAIDDRNTKDMNVVIKNSTFIGCQAGEGKDNSDNGVAYIYETDNTKATLENNTVDNETAIIRSSSDLTSAINNAVDGDTVILVNNVNYGSTQLALTKPVTIDLNGNELSTSNNWGGTTVKGGASIVNGTINHTGNTAAIKAFQVGTIENVTINVTPTSGKVKGGIVVQNGHDTYIESIKNVTITGATNGIETYNCGWSTRTMPAIGTIENVTIDATDTGILLSATIGKIVNCTINGAKYGINMHLKGEFNVVTELENCKVSGGVYGIWAHDEKGIANVNNCKLSLTIDAASVISSLEKDFEDECLGVVTIVKP